MHDDTTALITSRGDERPAERAHDDSRFAAEGSTGRPIAAPLTIRVAIVDDHEMFSEGLARIIGAEAGLELVGTAASVSDAIAVVERCRPHVVLMDYRLPDGDGAQATARILATHPAVKVLMLSGLGGQDLLARAVEAGCVGLMTKDRPAADMVAAVRAASRGESVMRAADLSALLAELRAPRADDTRWLSERELTVLRLLARGHSTDTIAERLYLSVHTVRNHVRNILRKLGAHSKLEAVAIAARDGIVAISEFG